MLLSPLFVCFCPVAFIPACRSLLQLQCFGALQGDPLGSGVGGAAVQVYFASGSGRIEGSIKVSSLRAVGVLANYTTLSSTVGVSRLNLPLVLSTTVTFSLAGSSSTSGVEAFDVVGSGRSSGFVVPVVQNMKWATTTNGTALIDVNIPQAACFNLTLETLSDFGTTDTISANDDLTPSAATMREGFDSAPWFAAQLSSLTVPQLLAQQKDSQASPGNFGVEPRQLLSMLRSGALQLLPMLLQRGLSIPLPLSESMSQQQESFGARLENYSEAVSTLEAWLQFPGVPTTSVAVAQSRSTFCTGSLSTSAIDFTVAVNDHNTTTCTLPADPDRATCTMSKLATQLSGALASCGLGGLFEVNATAATSSEDTCGGLSMYDVICLKLQSCSVIQCGLACWRRVVVAVDTNTWAVVCECSDVVVLFAPSLPAIDSVSQLCPTWCGVSRSMPLTSKCGTAATPSRRSLRLAHGTT